MEAGKGPFVEAAANPKIRDGVAAGVIQCMVVILGCNEPVNDLRPICHRFGIVVGLPRCDETSTARTGKVHERFCLIQGRFSGVGLRR